MKFAHRLSVLGALALALVAQASVSAAPAVAQSDEASARAAKLGDRPLREGASGADVRQLQHLLRKAGFKMQVDGRFGAGTKRAVQRFQRAVCLEDSGVVGRKTVAALRRSTRDAGGAHTSAGGMDADRRQRNHHLGDRVPLRRGMHGHDVKVLQDYLRRAGLRTSVDGEFGRGTWRVVRKFEREQGREVDGVVHAADIYALRVAVEGDRSRAPEKPSRPAPLQPGEKASVGKDGLAIAPEAAPEAVKQIIAAGNEIAKKPYRYGGGHGRWEDTGYDCSGSVSYALHGAGLLEQSMPSGGFMSWGESGPGRWVTIYANEGHMYMVVAGIRFDTSGRSRAGTRWQADMRSTRGYTVRHPPGL